MLNNNSKNTNKRNVALYVRTAAYDGSYDVINKQRLELHEFAAKNDMCIVKEYIDNGFSGNTFRCPEFIRMIEAAQSEPDWDAVIVKDATRFFRDRELFIQYNNLLQHYDIELISAQESVKDIANKDLTRRIFDFVGDYYCEFMKLPLAKKQEVVDHE